MTELFPGKRNFTCWQESNCSQNVKMKLNLNEIKVGFWEPAPVQSSTHCRTLKGNTISSNILSAFKRKLQKLGANWDEGILLLQQRWSWKSQDGKGPLLWRNNCVCFSVFPDICNTNQHAGIFSERSNWLELGICRLCVNLYFHILAIWLEKMTWLPCASLVKTNCFASTMGTLELVFSRNNILWKSWGIWWREANIYDRVLNQRKELELIDGKLLC